MQNRSRQRCAACGAEAPVSSRFCGQCGKPLASLAEEMPQPEGQPTPQETPIFLHTSTRSYQVVGEAFTPPTSSKTRPLPWSWLEETLQSEPPPRPPKTRPFPFPSGESGRDSAPPPDTSPEPPQPFSGPHEQAPFLPHLARTPATPLGGATGKGAEWLSSVVADLEGHQPAPNKQRSRKRLALLLLLASVGLAVISLAVFLLSSHRL